MNEPGHLAYERKLGELQRYIPFLRKMITKLERTNDPARSSQLQKMRHLHGILTDRTRKLKYDLLVKCEGVLQKLHDKIEGEPDDEVMEVPAPVPPRPPEVPRPMLYPESEWERPSPPRDLPPSQASTSSSSSVRQSEEIPQQHSPPLSSFVERISMSSPSNYNEMVQPRSPSPEVVAQIPGAFAQGREPSDKRFEKGREILRKLMVGMSKTLDVGEGTADLDQPRTGPKIIPLERASDSGTPDTDSIVHEDEDERLRGGNDAASGRSLVGGPSAKDTEAYNPEVEWSEMPAKTSLRPQFMTKPPLSQADLEELNRELGTDDSSTGEKEKRDSRRDSSKKESEIRSGPVEGPSNRVSWKDAGDNSGWREGDRDSSSRSKITVRKGETLAEAKRRHFEDWKRAETEKFRERRKREKAEAKAADDKRSREGKSHHDPSKSSGHSHSHRKHHSADRAAHGSGHHTEGQMSTHADRRASADSNKSDGDRAKEPIQMSAERGGDDAIDDSRPMGQPHERPSAAADPNVQRVSEQLKKYSVQDLVKTMKQGLSPKQRKDVFLSPSKSDMQCPRNDSPQVLTNDAGVPVGKEVAHIPEEKKEAPVDDLQSSYKCLLIRNLPPNTLRQHVLRFLQGFGMIEMVLEVDFSFNCTGIGYVQLVDHAEAEHAMRELSEKLLLGKPVKMAPCAEGIFREAMRTYEQTMNAREEQYTKRQESLSTLQPPPMRPHLSTPLPRNFQSAYPVHTSGQSPRPLHPAAPGFSPRSPHPGLLRYGPGNLSPHTPNIVFQKQGMAPRPPTPGSQPSTKPFYNPYDARPGKPVPEKMDPRLDRNDPRWADHLHQDPRSCDPRTIDTKLHPTDPRKHDSTVGRTDPRQAGPRQTDPRIRHADRPHDPRIHKGDARLRVPRISESSASEADVVSQKDGHKSADPRLNKVVARPSSNDPRHHSSPSTSKPDPKTAARLSFEEQYKHKKEKELAVLRKRKEEREKQKCKERSRSSSRSSLHEKKSSSGMHKAASLSSFKIPKLKRVEPVEERKEAIEEPVTKSVTEVQPSETHPEPLAAETGTEQEKHETADCHQEDVVSSTVDTDELLGRKKKKKRTRIVVISDSESDSETSRDAQNEEKTSEENKVLAKTRKSDKSTKGQSQDISEELNEPENRDRVDLPSAPDKTVDESDSEEGKIAVESDVEKEEEDQPALHEEPSRQMKKPVVVLTRSDLELTMDAKPRNETDEPPVQSPSEPSSFVSEEPASLTTEAETPSIKICATEPQSTDAEAPDDKASLNAEVATKDVEEPVSSSPIPMPRKRDAQIEPEECEYCPFNGKRIIPHYIISHPGKPISVKMPSDMLQEALDEDIGPGDDSAKTPLSPELEKQLINDDLSWIPSTLQFDYNVACRYCKFTALNKRHMLQHIADHLQTGTSAPHQYSLRCRFCKIKNSSSHDMADHVSSHTGEYRYACGHCGYRVFRMFHLKNHVSGTHKGKSHDEVTIEDMKVGNDWVYGYVCKLCGYVQLNEKKVKKHMVDCHEGGEEMTRINLVLRGPPVDMSKKVSEALRRQKAEEEKRAAALPPPIEDITVFEVGEAWLRDQSAQVSARRAQMDALMTNHATRLTPVPADRCGALLQKVASQPQTPLQYLEAERERRTAEQAAPPPADEEPASQEAEPEPEPSEEPAAPPDAGSDSEPECPESLEPELEPPPEEHPPPPVSALAAELRDSVPQDASQFGYQVALRLAGALEARLAPPSPTRAQPQPPPHQACEFTVKQEPLDATLSESAAAGLSAMNADLESLMNEFDQFEQEQRARPTLRIRKLSGDLFSSADSENSGTGGMGLMISSVMSLTGGTDSDAGGASRPGEDDAGLFAFPPDGERRPWKHFLTLKDQSKVMRLMFHMHHKSAYKCNAVHCSFTTNNGTLFKLHLRNHERCDICAAPCPPGAAGYTCMNTRLVCVYCGYQGADLAEHVYRRHAVSQFQCGYCFYRTRQNAYMHEHQRRWHADMPTYFLQSDPANPPPGLNASHLQQTEMVGESSLEPYVCAQPDCSGSFIKAAVLEQHYTEFHPEATTFPCHICTVTSSSFKSLVAHYIGHGYVAYHCAYCTYANQNQNSVKKHLIDFHPDDPPKCYARIPKSMGLDAVSTTPSPAPMSVPFATAVKQESSVETEAATVKEESRPELEHVPSEPPPVELEEAADSAALPAKQPETTADQQQPTEERPLLAEDLYRCGNPRCSTRCETLAAFREHLSSCPLNEAGQLLCYHCPKQVKHITTALEHVRTHGPHRYACSLCEYRAAMPSYVTKHMKQQHRVLLCSTLPQQPNDTADPERDAFVVYPKALVPRAEQPAEASGGGDRTGYGPEDADQLPRRPVLFRPVACQLCAFSTKVTRNLWKHLLRHRAAAASSDASPPTEAPTNPRPCDQRQAMMFDQMANLASSSGEVGTPRRQPEITPADLERLPKEVGEDKRYVCSLPNCNYLTLNDTMLKYHIQALHGQMITYPCPHCDDLYMIPDKLSAHLRLHGPRLYKCKYCIYNHYQRSLVTRHVRDKHPMLPLVDLVVREPDDDQTAAKPVFKPWRCGLCRYAALTRPEAEEHAAAAHDLRSQYKCGLCCASGVARTDLQPHFSTAHPNQPVKVFAIYYKLDEEVAESTVRAEQCQPIWQRNNPRRIRHVRGILIEEVKVPRGASASPQKRGRKPGRASSSPAKRSPAPTTLKPERMEPAARKAAADQVRRRALKKALRRPAARRLRAAARLAKRRRRSPLTSTSPSVSPEPEVHEIASSPEPSEPASSPEKPAPPQLQPAQLETEDEFLSLYDTQTKTLEFGPLGDAVDGMFCCPKCNSYKTKRKQDFVNHLYRELNYNRFVCGNCGHMNTTLSNLKRHHEQAHKPARVPEALVPLTPDRELELWIEQVLERQQQQLQLPLPQPAPKPDAAPPPAPPAAPATPQPSLPKPELAEPSEPPADTPASPPAKPGQSTTAQPPPPPPAAGSPRKLLTYKCVYCSEMGTIPKLRVHWKAVHPAERFKVIKPAERYVCRLCAYGACRPALMRTHLAEKHPGSSQEEFAREDAHRELRYRCDWCKERYRTLAAGQAHHERRHSGSQLKLVPYVSRALRKKPDAEPHTDGVSAVDAPTQAEAGVEQQAPAPEATPPAAPAQSSPTDGLKQCPVCAFTTERWLNIEGHLSTHYKRFRCGWCQFTDRSRAKLVQHLKRHHHGEPENIQLLEDVHQQFMQAKQRLREARSAAVAAAAAAADSGPVKLPAASPTPSPSPGPRGQKRPAAVVNDTESAEQQSPPQKRPSKGGVARKSTARSRLQSRSVRAVALKSTAGLRRSKWEPFSFYGRRPPPVSEFSEVTTPLMVGGASAMRVNVPTLAQIVKLYPRCRCVDLRRTSSLPL